MDRDSLLHSFISFDGKDVLGSQEKPTLRSQIAYKKLSCLRDRAIGGYYAVQSHSRSLILIPIESPYATSY